MNDTLMQDSLKVANKVLVQHSESDKSNNLWMWVAILEMGIIAILLLKDRLKLKESAKRKFKNESLRQDIDFNNIINSSFNSIQLYDELKVKCHPDRFPTEKDKNEIAEALFQEISKNKTNVKRLLELKEEAKQKLNINF
jgi:hypothetical protein